LPVNSTSVGSRSYSNLLFQSKVIGNIGSNGYVSGGFDVLTNYPMYFLRAGYHNLTSTGVYDRGSSGYYWSKSSYSTTHAYFLYFYSSNVHPRSNYPEAYGWTVRCVAL